MAKQLGWDVHISPVLEAHFDKWGVLSSSVSDAIQSEEHMARGSK